MIDLHCHILPAIDDGAKDLSMALAMVEMASGDGITTIACTPHIYPGVYPNTHQGIAEAVAAFKEQMSSKGFELALGYGADIHMDVQLVTGLKSQALPTLFGSRYFLLEMPNHFPVNILQDSVFNALSAGFVPIITHPERQGWCDRYYAQLRALVQQGVWVQITANSLTQRFGKTAQHRAERLLDDGLVALIASDAHNVSTRPPILSEGYEMAKKWVGKDEAWHMVRTRPAGVVSNLPPDQLPAPLVFGDMPEHRRAGLWTRIARVFQ